MSLRGQLLLYLAVMEIFPLAMAVHFFLAGDLLWFFAMELAILLTAAAGFIVLRNALRPVELIQSGKVMLQDRSFGNRLKLPGIRELDEVVHLFNVLLEELHQEQLKLGEQKGFFDRLLQATPIGIVIYDFDGYISSVNPAAEQMLELREFTLKGGSFAGYSSPLVNAISECGQSLPALITLPDGRRFRVQQSMFHDRGFPRQFLMMEELTREVLATERQAYEKLIQMTSHEVNNTIGATNSLLQGCRDYREQLREEDREDFAKALQVVMSRNSKLAEFMRRLAQVVRLPAPDCQPVDLEGMIRNVQAMFAAELESRNITWTLQCEALPLVNLDQHLFEQVLINILKNGYEAIEQDGALVVSLHRGNDGVELVVEDSAGALHRSDPEKLFKPFYSSKPKGQGIGLMLVREILHLHGFRYSLDCEPGRWTRFTIQF